MAESQFRVRDLIFAYESQRVTHTEKTQNGTTEETSETLRQRTKSIGNLFSFAKIFRSNKSEITSVGDIEKELVKLDAHLHYYQDYNKETHVAFQEEIFNVLTSIVIIDSRGDESISQKKKELLAEVQRLVTVLNKKLPYGSNKQGSNSIKFEQVQSHSIKTTQQHNKVQDTATVMKQNEASTEAATPNGTSKIEPFKNSDVSAEIMSTESNHKNSLKYVPYSQVPDSPAVLNDIEPSLIPSVSKLKQRFQSARSTTSEAHEITGVTAASYSGLSRSQSMKVTSRTSSEVRLRRSETSVKRSGTLVEETQVHEVHSEVQGGAEVKHEEAHEEQVQRRDEGDGRLQENPSGLVSVFKLKNLFEVKSKETSQGNYMSYTGLLRTNSRSKSISDLHDSTGPQSLENQVEKENRWKENVNDLSEDRKNVPVEITPYDTSLEESNTDQGFQTVTASNENSSHEGEIVLTPATSTAQIVLSCPTGLPVDQSQQLYSENSTSYTSQSHHSFKQETHTVVSSSSSSKSSQSSVIEVVQNPVSYSTLSFNGQTESATLTNGEEKVEKPANEKPTVKIEDVTEEYFKNADVSENLDEEFNKLLEASDIEAKS